MFTINLSFQRGRIDQVIINFNGIFTIFVSYYLFKQKIDWQIIIDVFLTVLISSFGLYEHLKINKN